MQDVKRQVVSNKSFWAFLEKRVLVIILRVSDYRFTPYFENEVLRKRPYLTKDMCLRVLAAPVCVEAQAPDRYRFWAAVEELGGRYLRVVTLSDKLTEQNAFPDRRFKP